MSPDSVTATRTTDPRYAALEERVLARDQKGASEVYYGLVRDGRPLPEMLREAVRIHAPYTHVPYHERIDDGYVNFVNNDHCLLSARAALQPVEDAAGAARRACRWRRPSGTSRPASTSGTRRSPRRPATTARGFQMPDGPPPAPVVHWPDQEPLALDGPLKERLDHWMTLVHRGQVLDAYRVFLGLMQNPAERRAALAELVLRRPDRRAGPLLPQPLLHHRPQILPRPRHRRARRRDRLGQRARRALCRRARHRRRPALVLALRDGLQRHH